MCIHTVEPQSYKRNRVVCKSEIFITLKIIELFNEFINLFCINLKLQRVLGDTVLKLKFSHTKMGLAT